MPSKAQVAVHPPCRPVTATPPTQFVHCTKNSFREFVACCAASPWCDLLCRAVPCCLVLQVPPSQPSAAWESQCITSAAAPPTQQLCWPQAPRRRAPWCSWAPANGPPTCLCWQCRGCTATRRQPRRLHMLMWGRAGAQSHRQLCLEQRKPAPCVCGGPAQLLSGGLECGTARAPGLHVQCTTGEHVLRATGMHGGTRAIPRMPGERCSRLCRCVTYAGRRFWQMQTRSAAATVWERCSCLTACPP